MKPKGGKQGPKVKKPKTEYHVHGNVFTSWEEYRVYMKLAEDPSVVKIALQPEYTVLEKYNVRCGRCRGTGKVTNLKTGNPNKCSLCKGIGTRQGRNIVYIADFEIMYEDGYIEVIDAKGDRKQSDDPTFAIKKKLFEALTGINLVVYRVGRGKNGKIIREDV